MNDDGAPKWKWFVGRLLLILLALLLTGIVRGFFHKEKNYKIEPTPEEKAHIQDEVDRMFDQIHKEESERVAQAIMQEMADLSTEVVTGPPPADQTPNSSQSNP